MQSRVSFEPDVTSLCIASHANFGRYLIEITTLRLQDADLLGVNAEMYVVNDRMIPRSWYLRRVTLDTYLEYRERLYANEKDEEELMRRVVDMRLVSGIQESMRRC